MTDNINADQTIMSDETTQSAFVDPLAKLVSDELKASNNIKKNPFKQLSTLLISLILFVSFGLFNGSVRGIIVLVVVIFIHETGHLIGMKLMKYKDVQMFFIPLFGAAVSGNAVMPSGVKKATVSLLGPVPGILLGLITGGIYIQQMSVKRANGKMDTGMAHSSSSIGRAQPTGFFVMKRGYPSAIRSLLTGILLNRRKRCGMQTHCILKRRMSRSRQRLMRSAGRKQSEREAQPEIIPANHPQNVTIGRIVTGFLRARALRIIVICFRHRALD